MIGGFIGNPVGGVVNVSSIFLTAGSGVYAIAGQPAALNARITVAAGSYMISGRDIALADRMAAGAGAYAIAGQTAAFSPSVAAAAGSYAVTGQAASFASRVPVASGAYAISAQAASFNPGATVAAGSYAITGSAITFSINWPVAPGSYTLTGSPAAYFELIHGAGGDRRREGGGKTLYRGKLEIARRKIIVTDDEGRTRRVDLLRHLKPPPPFAPAPEWVLPDVDVAPQVEEARPIAPVLPAPQLPESLLALQDARDENDLVELLTNSPDPLVEDIHQVLALLHARGELERLAENA